MKSVKRRQEMKKQTKQAMDNLTNNARFRECPYCSGAHLKLFILGKSCDQAAIQCIGCGLTHISSPKKGTLEWNDDSVREELVENHIESIRKIKEVYPISTIITYDENDIIHVKACIEATAYRWSNLKSRIDRAIGLSITEPRDIVTTLATAVLVSPELDGLFSNRILVENVSWEKAKEVIASEGAYLNTKNHRILVKINRK